MMGSMDFWTRFKAAVRDQRTTQEWVAGKAGISFFTLRGWIAKGRLPDAVEAVAIARVLGTTVEYLVEGAAMGGLGGREASLLERAERYDSIIAMLDALTPEVREMVRAELEGLIASPRYRSSER